jgi:tetratricopeptide (TPR) repeat protein
MPIELPGIVSGANGKAFRIFVSSPGDLGDERLTCARVIERIKDEFAHVARIESILWEQEPLTADASFQDQIPLPSETDLVVIMIWSRLGYRLHSRYKEAEDSEAPTGTIFEFRNALRGRRTSADHRPDIMVYRKTAEPPKPSVKNEEAYLRTIEEWKKVESFFNSQYFRQQGEGSFTGAYHTFQRAADFEENIYAHLRKLIERRLGAASEDAARPPVWSAGSPFRGLEFFDFKHSPIFFGRSGAAAEVRDALRRQAGRGTAFVLVMGMSGGGKSSLVRAGVLPDLVAPGVIEGISLWRRVILRPSEAEGDPFRGLANALIDTHGEPGVGLPELGLDAEAVAKKLRIAADAHVEGALRQAAAVQETVERAHLKAKREDKESSGETDAVAELDRLLADLRPPMARLALVIDQMEELFTDLRIDAAQREAFIQVLAELVRGGHCWVIATLRSDFFARCEEIPALVQLKGGDGTYHLLPPAATEISQMIRQPAIAAGLCFEEDAETKERLDDTLLAAALREPSALPLLEFTLDELYKKCAPQGNKLLLAAYRELGGLEGALERRADDTFGALPSADPGTALRAVLSALVRIAPAEELRPVSQPAPQAAFPACSPAAQLVDSFVEARLFISDRGMVRIAHEALLRWGKARDWIEENREFLIVRERVRVAAGRWCAEGETADLLLPRGKLLAEAEAVLKAHQSEISPEDVEFIEASSAMARAELERRKRITRRVIAGITSALVVAVIFGAVSFTQYRRAQEAKVQADQATARATHARDEAEKLISFMTFDLSDKLEPIGRLDLLDDVNKRVRDYYQAFTGQEDNPDILRQRAVALGKQGDVLTGRGDLSGALKSYRDSLTISGKLANQDPSNALWQRDLSVSAEKVGDVLNAQGDFAGALKSYRESLAIREKLTHQDSSNADQQRDLSRSYEKVGDVLKAQGDLTGALKSYHDSLAIREKLAHQDPSNADWQRDLSVSYNRVGGVLNAQGDLAGAHKSYRDSLAISEKLANQDPSNAGWQRDLSVSYNKVGDVLNTQGDLAGALKSYGDSLEISKKLAHQDPSNADWQRDLSVSYNKVGSVLNAQGDLAGALKSYRDSLAIREKLAHQDPSNAEWQDDLEISCCLVATALLRIDVASKPEARQLLERGRDILQNLERRNGLSAVEQRRLEAIKAALRSF